MARLVKDSAFGSGRDVTDAIKSWVRAPSSRIQAPCAVGTLLLPPPARAPSLSLK